MGTPRCAGRRWCRGAHLSHFTPTEIGVALAYVLAVGLIFSTLWKRVAEYERAKRRLEAMRRQHDP